MSHLWKINSFCLAYTVYEGLAGALWDPGWQWRMWQEETRSPKGFALANKHSRPAVAYINSNHNILSRTNSWPHPNMRKPGNAATMLPGCREPDYSVNSPWLSPQTHGRVGPVSMRHNPKDWAHASAFIRQFCFWSDSVLSKDEVIKQGDGSNNTWNWAKRD